jgi:integrase
MYLNRTGTVVVSCVGFVRNGASDCRYGAVAIGDTCSVPHKHERIFGPTTSLADFRTSYIRKRRTIAYALSNPRLSKITFHTFRHWGATMLYAKTKDILLVKQKLGHRYIENTMVYTQLINFESDEWHVAHAKTLIEEDNLISNGFEFVRYDQNENLAIYRKRK